MIDSYHYSSAMLSNKQTWGMIYLLFYKARIRARFSYFNFWGFIRINRQSSSSGSTLLICPGASNKEVTIEIMLSRLIAMAALVLAASVKLGGILDRGLYRELQAGS